MKVLDPGHKYELSTVDGDGSPVILTFVKRDNPSKKYPGNIGHYAGTQFQEVLRALIDRAIYVNDQWPCEETKNTISLYREAIYQLESRARRIRGQQELGINLHNIEIESTCKDCGHILCLSHEVDSRKV